MNSSMKWWNRAAQSRGGRLRGRRGTMCQFESKEVCESLCFHNKSDCTGLRRLVV